MSKMTGWWRALTFEKLRSRQRILLCFIAALLFYAAFPPADLFWCAFAGPAVLILAVHGTGPGRAFVFGSLAGLAFHLASLAWVVGALRNHAGFALAWALASHLALCAALAAYFGLFAAIVSVVRNRWPLTGILASPFVWVAVEFLRSHLLTGFPWNLLGHTQHRRIALIQIASIAGVYAVSFVCVAFAAGVVALARARRDRRAVLTASAYLVVTVVLPWVAGGLLLGENLTEKDLPAMKVACIQSNVPQEIKWSPGQARNIYDVQIEMTRAAIGEGAALVIWSESSVPLDFQRTHWYFDGVQSLAVDNGIHIILGSTHAELTATRALAEQGDEHRLTGQSPLFAVAYYNSAFLVRADGTQGRRYDKIKLVPFSEYNPYKRILWFFPRLVQAASDFSQGRTRVVNEAGGYRIGTSICYEAIFPALSRQFAQQRADLLVNITNDGWFGESAAPAQHYLASVFRAVENRRWFVRCANTGISAVIDPFGRPVATGRLAAKRIVVADVKAVTTKSPYTRFGDLLAWVSSLATVPALAAAICRRQGGLKKTQGSTIIDDRSGDSAQ